MAMLETAWQAGVPMRRVAGDEVYGDSPELRDLIARRERWYVLAVRTHTPVWTARPPVVEPDPDENASGGKRTVGDDRQVSRRQLAREPLAASDRR